ncbi:MAG: DUF4007 family protein [Peptococcaceae bacterium]|jgi:hypothetical protein|nr:DUF4007 family protein [Peptococcaceae bacterium]MDH7523747.1 DUF4007 family protein [Peptococcaceae bacterium]
MLTETLNYKEYIEKGNLGRHETFTPRYGWLKKGYDAIRADSNAFKAEDAIERLGVGKNMVQSIRYWCLAFKLINPNYETTKLGDKLFSDEGWDPFLEDLASLWLLHWQLFVPTLEAINWCFAFNKPNLLSFDNNLLSKALATEAQKYERMSNLSATAFAKDASCIIRMYLDEEQKDSEIYCPFTQLGLIQKAEANNSVMFNMREKQSLPDLIFAAACFSYMQFYANGQRTISLQRLTYDFNSPGAAFKLSESMVGSYLDQAIKKITGVSLVSVIGSIQLHIEREPEDLYWEALEKYYSEQ